MPQESSRGEAECPYCRHDLKKFPSRKARCQACKNEYYVRTDPETREKLILTLSEVEVHEEKQKTFYLISAFEDKLRNMVEERRFSKIEQLVQNDLRSRFGEKIVKEDAVWSLSNALALDAIRNQDIDLLRRIYWQQGLFLHERGREHLFIIRKFYELQLSEYRNSDVVKSVEIITAGQGSCSACREQDGKIFSITDALKLMPLPCRSCCNEMVSGDPVGWCRCVYGPVVDNH